MKKLLFFVFIVIIFYFAQVLFMGFFNQKIISNLEKENDFFVLKSIKYEKGFFDSNAKLEIILKDLNNIAYTEDFINDEFNFAIFKDNIVKVDLNLKNNIFAINNIKANFSNIKSDMDFFKDEVFLHMNARALPFLDYKMEFIFSDIKNNINNLEMNDVKLLSFVDKNLNLKTLKLNIRYFSLNDIKIQNIEYDILQDNTNLNNLNLKNAESNIKINNIDILNDINVKDFNLFNEIELNKDEKTFNIHFKGLISKLNYTNYKFNDINMDLIIKNISNDFILELENYNNDKSLLNLFSILSRALVFDPSMDMIFSFGSKDKNQKDIYMSIDLKSHMNLDGYDIKAYAISDVLPSQFMLELDYFDQFFVKNNNKFELNLKANQKENIFILNGEDFDPQIDF